MSLKILIRPILNVNRKEAGQFNAICGGERCHFSALLPQKCTFALLCKKETFCNCRLSFKNFQDRFGTLSHLCSKNLCFHIFWIGGFGGLGVEADCRIGSIGPSVHGGRITPQPPKPVHRTAVQTAHCIKYTACCQLYSACFLPHTTMHTPTVVHWST